jgi:hypothetical protein
MSFNFHEATPLFEPMKERSTNPEPAASPGSRISRARISHELAFPLGYELLQQALGDTPQWPELSIEFSKFPTISASEFARVLRTQEPYAVVRLRHFFFDMRAFATFRGSWGIYIYPVPRALKSVAHSALLGQPLAALREFLLAAPVSPTHEIECAILFDPVEHTCKVAVA